MSSSSDDQQEDRPDNSSASPATLRYLSAHPAIASRRVAASGAKSAKAAGSAAAPRSAGHGRAAAERVHLKAFGGAPESPQHGHGHSNVQAPRSGARSKASPRAWQPPGGPTDAWRSYATLFLSQEEAQRRPTPPRRHGAAAQGSSARRRGSASAEQPAAAPLPYGFAGARRPLVPGLRNAPQEHVLSAPTPAFARGWRERRAVGRAEEAAGAELRAFMVGCVGSLLKYAVA